MLNELVTNVYDRYSMSYKKSAHETVIPKILFHIPAETAFSQSTRHTVNCTNTVVS